MRVVPCFGPIGQWLGLASPASMKSAISANVAAGEGRRRGTAASDHEVDHLMAQHDRATPSSHLAQRLQSQGPVMSRTVRAAPATTSGKPRNRPAGRSTRQTAAPAGTSTPDWQLAWGGTATASIPAPCLLGAVLSAADSDDVRADVGLVDNALADNAVATRPAPSNPSARNLDGERRHRRLYVGNSKWPPPTGTGAQRHRGTKGHACRKPSELLLHQSGTVG